MKRLILAIILGLIAVPYAGAQLWKMKRYEASAGLGTSQFYGDVGGFTIGQNALGIKDLTFLQTRFNASASFRYFIIDNAAARFTFSYVMLHATDERGSNETRAMEALTSVFEPALIGEYYFFRNQQRNNYSFQAGRGRTGAGAAGFFKSLDFYVLAGIGGAGYNVKGNDVLDAKNMKNKGFTAVIPLGLGVKMTFDPNILFGIELCGRYAFSDYLDGYTSPFSARNDVYHTFNFTFSYRIKTARNGLPSFR